MEVKQSVAITAQLLLHEITAEKKVICKKEKKPEECEAK